jgi:putative alpha-1,2-mannosidase
MKKLTLIICFFTFCVNLSAQKDYTKYVNPFIGTGGHGHTFPGATVPFGAVQLSPDTRTDNWDGSSGYHYSDNEIFGFSHTHLSGTGIPDYCDILLMPTVGEVDFNDFKSTFSHANEKAEAGYYSVKPDNGITAELTATTRVGVHRYTFPKTDKANIVLDLGWRDKVLDSRLEVVGSNRVEGFRRSESWAKNQIIYFAVEFSKPFKSSIFFGNGINLSTRNQLFQIGTDVKGCFQFKTLANEKIVVKVAISAVSIENARLNLKTEVPHWNFDKVRADAKAVWNKELGQIEVTDDNVDNLTKFYTALYHTKIQPNVFQDVNGDYRGLDGKTHNAPKDTNYTVFSLWDTFRAAHPLYTIIDEKRTVQFINTFIRQYEQGGRLPVWELAGNETDCMIGYHAVSVIADAMAKSIKGFDYEKAFEASKHSAELNHFGLETYKKKGFISMEDENESVSKTLEYAYDDYCIAVMAKILAEKDKDKFEKTRRGRIFIETAKNEFIPFFERYNHDRLKYLKRSQSYKNLFDSETGFMRPRQNGGFISPFKPNEVSFHFTEGNSWVYSFFVPHDIGGLIDLQGGKVNFAKKLDELFSTKDELIGREQPDITGLIGQYAHGNEPSHHIAYLYNYADQPWKTQKLVRQILDEFYKNDPDGLIGNEDCGQMSAWFILSSLGFYQVNPSRPFYDIGTPLFKEAKINLENRKSFIIKASNVSDKNIYVKSVKLGGGLQKSTMLSHRDLMSGTTLEFEMTDKPNETIFSEFSSSAVGEIGLVAVPIIEAKERVFKETTQVLIKSNTKDAKIIYSIDGNEPNTEYRQTFTIEKDAIIKAVAINSKGEKSQIVEAKVHKLPHDWSVKLFSKYNRQYTGGGEIGLIDGIRGTVNFASGEWQGYQSQDFIAVIDLQTETEIHKIGGGFLQVARSWIWMPTKIEFEVSSDNVSFTKIAEIKTDVAPEDMNEQFRDYIKEISPVKTRYVRVKATNLGKIPAWHAGAGFDAFIFVDEIIIE